MTTHIHDRLPDRVPIQWEQTIATARAAAVPTDSILDATARVFLAQEIFTQAMSSAYRQQTDSADPRAGGRAVDFGGSATGLRSRRSARALNALPAEERTLLLNTFRAWVEAGGSANETAAAIYCHPNTVRHRLHRVEELTCRSLSRPKDLAEVCLAFEVKRRLP